MCPRTVEVKRGKVQNRSHDICDNKHPVVIVMCRMSEKIWHSISYSESEISASILLMAEYATRIAHWKGSENVNLVLR